jgi:exodeoxyribonuclease VII large subunit
MMILAAARRHLGVAGERLRSTFPRLKRSSEEIVRRSAERLAAFERECALRDPRRLLERGYGVMRVGGKLIKSVRDVRSGDFIEARLSDGTFSANVLGVTPVSVSPKGKTHEKI